MDEIYKYLKETGWRFHWKPGILIKGGHPGWDFEDIMYNVPLELWERFF